MELKISNRFLVGKKIGSGSFGDIFLGQDLDRKLEVAIKLESIKSKHPQLLYESKLLRVLKAGEGIPNIHWYGEEGDFRIMVSDLLGPNLEDLLIYSGHKFTLKTVLMLTNQLLKRLEYLHEKDFIHRDIKPENFLIGLGKQGDKIFMIDYGLAKKYRDPRTNLHIPCKENKNLTGTIRYASISTHLGIEQSRRDDLESLSYVLIYFLRGNLPWQGVTTSPQSEKILEIKVATPISELCYGFPEEFATFVKYSRSLKFEERPDYTWIQRIFKDLINKLNFQENLVFDWTFLSIESERLNNLNKRVKTDKSDSVEHPITGKLKITVLNAKNLPIMDMVGSTDGFCRIFIIKSDGIITFPTQIIEKNEFRTQTIHENNNPIWNYDGVIEFSFFEREIDLWKLGTEVWDEDTSSSDLIGKGEVYLKKLLNKPGKKLKFEIELFDNKLKKIENSTLNLEITFEIEQNK